MTIYLILSSSVLLSLLGVTGLSCFKNSSSPPWAIIGLLSIILLLPLGVYLPGLTWNFSIGTAKSPEQGLSWASMITLVWGGGAFLAALRMLRDVHAFRVWSKRATPIDEAETLQLLMEVSKRANVKAPSLYMSSALSSPVLGGLMKPGIYLPAHYQEWGAETLKVVFWHEVGHLVRRDLWKQHFAQLILMLHWFNPLLRKLKSALSYQCELACDAWVVKSGVCRKVYLNALCDVAQSIKQTPSLPYALSMAEHATLSTRVKTLVNAPLKKRPLTITVFLLSLMLIGIGIVSTKATSDGSLAQEVSIRLSASPFPMD